MTTMKDVAAAAGVSVSTVSHVLNQTRKVDAATEDKVRQAIEAIGYVHNTLARSLAQSSSKSIGVCIPALSNHYFAETVYAIENACFQHGLMMLFADTREDPEHQKKVLEEFQRRRVDGIIIAPCMEDSSFSHLERLAQKIPVVLIDRVSDIPVDQVAVENVQSTRQMIEHLMAKNHQRIGFISGLPQLTTSQERVAGYELAHRTCGSEPDPALVRCGYSTIEGAFEATMALLHLADRPSAIMTGNNLMTIGALRALQAMGLRIPDDVALAGFDDFDWAELIEPKLTVVQQPVQLQGERAVQLLVARIANPAAPQVVQRLDPKLVLRTSC